MISELKSIEPVPMHNNLIDIVLSSTQRKTPTVIHPQLPIQRIRSFYMRKVKHTSSEFVMRFQNIIMQFPRLEDVHPFYSDLINVLYDKDHYKMALGHLNTVSKSIQNISKEFLRLLKFGDTAYRCKQLKRSALGKMTSSVKKLKSSLEYLEEVRQHMSRLPSIDLYAHTLLICGYPNVGKSSLINKISKAKVEVQPYAFTTKSLYVGHFELKGVRYQIIDTPGILDQSLENRNTIEMQSIIALAHIKALSLFFFDLSESCGFSISDQISLFNSLKSLLTNFLIVLSKSDLRKIEELEPADIEIVKSFLHDKKWIEICTRDGYNLEKLKEVSCSMIDHPDEKDSREVFIPKSLKGKDEYSIKMHQKCSEKESIEKALLKKHEKQEQKEGLLIPEFYQGKNVADMILCEVPERLSIDRNYDILGKDMRTLQQDINDRIQVKIREHISRRRQSIPSRWKGRGFRSEFIPEVKMREVKMPLKKKRIPIVPKIINKLPKHLYRGRSKHGERR